MSDCLYAYLAGAMDSDGSFGIKRSTYHIRVRGDATNPVYFERVSLKQVTPDIPELLQTTFGGGCYKGKPGTNNSKPLYVWQATNKKAANACIFLLPYLRIKKTQALLLLELRETKKVGYGQLAYWFAQEHPEWATMEMITTTEAAQMLGYSNRESISQSLHNGTLLALPYDFLGRERPRVPRLLVEQMVPLLSKNGKAHTTPPQLITWRERLWNDIRELNKTGIHGTPTYHRTGPYKLLDA